LSKVQISPAGGSISWLSGLICGLALTFATAPALLAGILMLPAVVALLCEHTSGRPVTLAVALMCACFTLGPVWQVFFGGNSFAVLLEQANNPMTFCGAWLAGACGWAMCEILPVVINVAADLRAAKAAAKLREDLKKEQEEWGLS